MLNDSFDFGFSPDGEIIIDSDTHDIYKSQEDELKIQLSYNRIKSISTNWFIDNIGADLESLIGKPCNKEYAEVGKGMIMKQLTFDNLWDSSEIHIKATIVDMIHLQYNVFFKIKDESTEDTSSYEIIAEIDLVKGVKIRYGWEPRK